MSAEVCGMCGETADCRCIEADCRRCGGLGEWDEGPLPARSIVQIDPEYLTVECPDCAGEGRIKCDRQGCNCPYADLHGRVPCYCEIARAHQQESADVRA